MEQPLNIELIALFAMIVALVTVPAAMKNRTKRAAFDLVARALERGQALDPDTIARLTEDKLNGERRRNNLAIGVVLIALAIGALASAAILVALATGVQLQDFLVPAVVLATLGAAFLLLAGLDRSPPR